MLWHADHDGAPLIIAHRGGALLGPENTAATFRLAAQAGAHAVETDVRRTADGALVCLHDDDLLRLCDNPARVADLDLAALRNALPDMLTLDQAIAASAPMGLLLDVKLTDGQDLQRILDEITRSNAMPRTLLGLRSLDLVARARGLSDAIAILAFATDPDSALAAQTAGANWFRLWQGDFTEMRAKAVRTAGLRLAVMVGQPRSEALPVYPQFPVGLVDEAGLARIAEVAPDAILLDDPRLLSRA